MLNGRGISEVQKMLHQIGRMADEMAKRAKKKPSAELVAMLSEQRTALDELRAAAERLRAAQAEIAKARMGLDESYASARHRYFRGRSWVYANVDPHASGELAAFGLLPPPQYRRAKRKKSAPTAASEEPGAGA